MPFTSFQLLLSDFCSLRYVFKIECCHAKDELELNSIKKVKHAIYIYLITVFHVNFHTASVLWSTL